MCNAKSKSKSTKDDLDEAVISDQMIVDLPSTSKPKPKSVSDPPNNNDTIKEQARKATKLAHNDEKQGRCPDHSNKHDDDKENDNDQNGYNNHDDNDESRHVNDDENQNVSVLGKKIDCQQGAMMQQ
jgi:hypothetical protein